MSGRRPEHRHPSIRSPMPCASCGYDLRGHASHEICPECARPVHDAVIRAEAHERRGDRVRHVVLAIVTTFWLTIVATVLMLIALTLVRDAPATRHLFALVLPCVVVIVFYLSNLPRWRSHVLNFGACLIVLAGLYIIVGWWNDLLG